MWVLDQDHAKVNLPAVTAVMVPLVKSAQEPVPDVLTGIHVLQRLMRAPVIPGFKSRAADPHVHAVRWPRRVTHWVPVGPVRIMNVPQTKGLHALNLVL